MAGLATIGTVSYNGFTFPPANRVKITTRPVYDSSDRVVKYDEITMRIDFIAHDGMDELPGVGFDSDMRLLYLLLSSPHKQLAFDDRGYGDIVIPTNYSEITQGPKPRIVHWEPIGANKAINISWEVVFSIARCTFSQNKRMTEYNYSYSWSIDSSGLTIRTISGHFEIASSFQAIGGNIDRIDKSADAYRDQIKFPVPDGFIRESQNFDLSEDRRILRFHLIDRQIQSRYPYPKGVKELSLTQRLSTNNLQVGQVWSVTISGSITLFTSSPKHHAWMAFSEVVRSRRQAVTTRNRRNAIERSLAEQNPNAVPYIEVDSFMITRELEIEDDIYGDTVSFRITWDLYSSRTHAFQASGLFLEPDNTQTWQQWTDQATHDFDAGSNVRGIADLKHNAEGEEIIHLCNSKSTTANESPANIIPKHLYDDTVGILPDPDSGTGDYIHYGPEANIIRLPGEVHQVPLNDAPRPYEPTEVQPLSTLRDPNYWRSMHNPSNSGNYRQPIRQVRHSPQFEIVFRGSAVRINRPIVQPEITSYQGIPVLPTGKAFFTQKRRILPMGQVFYIAAWEQRYLVQSNPYNKPLYSSEVSNPV